MPIYKQKNSLIIKMCRRRNYNNVNCHYILAKLSFMCNIYFIWIINQFLILKYFYKGKENCSEYFVKIYHFISVFFFGNNIHEKFNSCYINQLETRWKFSCGNTYNSNNTEKIRSFNRYFFWYTFKKMLPILQSKKKWEKKHVQKSRSTFKKK